MADEALNGTVAINEDGQFIVAWQTLWYPHSLLDTPILYREDVKVQRYQSDGTTLGSTEFLSQRGIVGHHYDPSIAMSPSGSVRVGWIGYDWDPPPLAASSEMWLDFDFDTFGFLPLAPILGDWDVDVSVGVSEVTGAATWADAIGALGGLLYSVGAGGEQQIRDCGDPSMCDLRRYQYQSCMSMRPDGKFAVAFADPEIPSAEDSPFNITLQLYNESGTTIGSEVLVNDPNWEPSPSDQTSPAVAFDEHDNIVVSWLGPRPLDASGDFWRVYARRFAWSGQPDEAPVAQGSMFIVNNDPNASVLEESQQVLAYPTVSLTTDEQDPGAFIVVWNARAL